MDSVKALLTDDITLVVKNNNVIESYSSRGIRQLYKLVERGKIKGAIIADKIVGKAAAMLYAYGGAKSVFAKTISKDATEVFKIFGIDYSFDISCDNIINREGKDLCPMELVVKDMVDICLAYKEIGIKLKSM